MADIIPGPDDKAVVWMRAFAAAIASDVQGYQIGDDDSKAIGSAVKAFEDAYHRSSLKWTRTAADVLLKNHARSQAECLCRKFAAFIKHNPNVTRGRKLAIGLRLSPPRRRRSNVLLPLS